MNNSSTKFFTKCSRKCTLAVCSKMYSIPASSRGFATIFRRKNKKNRSVSESEHIKRSIVEKSFTAHNKVTAIMKGQRLLYHYLISNSKIVEPNKFSEALYSCNNSIFVFVRELISFIRFLKPELSFNEICEFICKYSLSNEDYFDQVKIFTFPRPIVRDEIFIIGLNDINNIIKAGKNIDAMINDSRQTINTSTKKTNVLLDPIYNNPVAFNKFPEPTDSGNE